MPQCFNFFALYRRPCLDSISSRDHLSIDHVGISQITLFDRGVGIASEDDEAAVNMAFLSDTVLYEGCCNP